ncbi:hypothetical protein AAG603_09860 [Citromicrobium bathyomarinum]
MRASLHVLPPEDHDDIGKALTLRLAASEMAAQDGAMQGRSRISSSPALILTMMTA